MEVITQPELVDGSNHGTSVAVSAELLEYGGMRCVASGEALDADDEELVDLILTGLESGAHPAAGFGTEVVVVFSGLDLATEYNVTCATLAGILMDPTSLTTQGFLVNPTIQVNVGDEVTVSGMIVDTDDVMCVTVLPFMADPTDVRNSATQRREYVDRAFAGDAVSVGLLEWTAAEVSTINLVGLEENSRYTIYCETVTSKVRSSALAVHTQAFVDGPTIVDGSVTDSGFTITVKLATQESVRCVVLNDVDDTPEPDQIYLGTGFDIAPPAQVPARYSPVTFTFSGLEKRVYAFVCATENGLESDTMTLNVALRASPMFTMLQLDRESENGASVSVRVKTAEVGEDVTCAAFADVFSPTPDDFDSGDAIGKVTHAMTSGGEDFEILGLTGGVNYDVHCLTEYGEVSAPLNIRGQEFTQQPEIIFGTNSGENVSIDFEIATAADVFCVVVADSVGSVTAAGIIDGSLSVTSSVEALDAPGAVMIELEFTGLEPGAEYGIICATEGYVLSTRRDFVAQAFEDEPELSDGTLTGTSFGIALTLVEDDLVTCTATSEDVLELLESDFDGQDAEVVGGVPFVYIIEDLEPGMTYGVVCMTRGGVFSDDIIVSTNNWLEPSISQNTGLSLAVYAGLNITDDVRCVLVPEGDEPDSDDVYAGVQSNGQAALAVSSVESGLTSPVHIELESGGLMVWDFESGDLSGWEVRNIDGDNSGWDDDWISNVGYEDSSNFITNPFAFQPAPLSSETVTVPACYGCNGVSGSCECQGDYYINTREIGTSTSTLDFRGMLVSAPFTVLPDAEITFKIGGESIDGTCYVLLEVEYGGMWYAVYEIQIPEMEDGGELYGMTEITLETMSDYVDDRYPTENADVYWLRDFVGMQLRFVLVDESEQGFLVVDDIQCTACSQVLPLAEYEVYCSTSSDYMLHLPVIMQEYMAREVPGFGFTVELDMASPELATCMTQRRGGFCNLDDGFECSFDCEEIGEGFCSNPVYDNEEDCLKDGWCITMDGEIDYDFDEEDDCIGAGVCRWDGLPQLDEDRETCVGRGTCLVGPDEDEPGYAVLDTEAGCLAYGLCDTAEDLCFTESECASAGICCNSVGCSDACNESEESCLESGTCIDPRDDSEVGALTDDQEACETALSCSNPDYDYSQECCERAGYTWSAVFEFDPDNVWITLELDWTPLDNVFEYGDNSWDSLEQTWVAAPTTWTPPTWISGDWPTEGVYVFSEDFEEYDAWVDDVEIYEDLDEEPVTFVEQWYWPEVPWTEDGWGGDQDYGGSHGPFRSTPIQFAASGVDDAWEDNYIVNADDAMLNGSGFDNVLSAPSEVFLHLGSVTTGVWEISFEAYLVTGACDNPRDPELFAGPWTFAVYEYNEYAEESFVDDHVFIIDSEAQQWSSDIYSDVSITVAEEEWTLVVLTVDLDANFCKLQIGDELFEFKWTNDATTLGKVSFLNGYFDNVEVMHLGLSAADIQRDGSENLQFYDPEWHHDASTAYTALLCVTDGEADADPNAIVDPLSMLGMHAWELQEVPSSTVSDATRISYSLPFVDDVKCLADDIEPVSQPKLAGRVFSSDFGEYSTQGWMAVDGNEETFFEAVDPNGGYVGIYLDDSNSPELAPVGRIRFLPVAGGREAMDGGRFEGCETSAFTDCETLFTILGRPAAGWNDVRIDTENAYPYLRYLSPEEGNFHAQVAEIEFYPNDFAACVFGDTVTVSVFEAICMTEMLVGTSEGIDFPGRFNFGQDFFLEFTSNCEYNEDDAKQLCLASSLCTGVVDVGGGFWTPAKDVTLGGGGDDFIQCLRQDFADTVHVLAGESVEFEADVNEQYFCVTANGHVSEGLTVSPQDITTLAVDQTGSTLTVRVSLDAGDRPDYVRCVLLEGESEPLEDAIGEIEAMDPEDFFSILALDGAVLSPVGGELPDEWGNLLVQFSGLQRGTAYTTVCLTMAGSLDHTLGDWTQDNSVETYHLFEPAYLCSQLRGVEGAQTFSPTLDVCGVADEMDGDASEWHSYCFEGTDNIAPGRLCTVEELILQEPIFRQGILSEPSGEYAWTGTAEGCPKNHMWQAHVLNSQVYPPRCMPVESVASVGACCYSNTPTYAAGASYEQTVDDPWRCVVVPQGDEPSVEQVYQGLQSDGTDAVYATPIMWNDDDGDDVLIHNLLEGVDYDVFCATESNVLSDPDSVLIAGFVQQPRRILGSMSMLDNDLWVQFELSDSEVQIACTVFALESEFEDRMRSDEATMRYSEMGWALYDGYYFHEHDDYVFYLNDDDETTVIPGCNQEEEDECPFRKVSLSFDSLDTNDDASVAIRCVTEDGVQSTLLTTFHHQKSELWNYEIYDLTGDGLGMEVYQAGADALEVGFVDSFDNPVRIACSAYDTSSLRFGDTFGLWYTESAGYDVPEIDCSSYTVRIISITGDLGAVHYGDVVYIQATDDASFVGLNTDTLNGQMTPTTAEPNFVTEWTIFRRSDISDPEGDFEGRFSVGGVPVAETRPARDPVRYGDEVIFITSYGGEDLYLKLESVYDDPCFGGEERFRVGHYDDDESELVFKIRVNPTNIEIREGLARDGSPADSTVDDEFESERNIAHFSQPFNVDSKSYDIACYNFRYDDRTETLSYKLNAWVSLPEEKPFSNKGTEVQVQATLRFEEDARCIVMHRDEDTPRGLEVFAGTSDESSNHPNGRLSLIHI